MGFLSLLSLSMFSNYRAAAAQQWHFKNGYHTFCPEPSSSTYVMEIQNGFRSSGPKWEVAMVRTARTGSSKNGP